VVTDPARGRNSTAPALRGDASLSIGRPALFTRPFVLAWLANLAVNIGSCFALHIPGFLHELGAGEAQIGRIMAAYALSAFAAGPLCGRLIDRRGRTLVMRVGGVLYVIAASLYLVVSSLGPLVYIARMLEGVSGTLLYAALFTYAADVVPADRRTHGLALFGASGLAPMALSGALGDVLLEVAGYRAIFATALGFGTLGLLLCLPLRDVAIQRDAEPGRTGVRAALAQRDLRPVWAAAFAFFFALASLVTFFKTFVLANGYASVGTFFSVYAAVALILRTAFGALPDRIGLRRMVLPALACYAAGLGLLAHAHGSTAVLCAAALCGAGHGYAYPVLFSLVITRARPEQRGSAMSVYASVDWGGFLLSGPAMGLTIEHAGYPTAYSALALLLALGCALFYLLDRRAG
jgi:MFS family permease